MITIQCCAACKHFRCYNFYDEGECKNVDSDYYADWVSSSHHCEDYEDMEENLIR